MQGRAVALPPALFSAPPHLIFEEQFEFVPEYPEIPHHAPVCDLLLFSSNWRSFTYIHIYLRVSAYNNHWCRLCKMLVYLNIQNLLPEKQKEWIMNLRLDCKIHNSELWRHMFSISNYSCLMLKSMYLLDLEDELVGFWLLWHPSLLLTKNPMQ